MGHAEFTLRDQLQLRRISLDEYWMPFAQSRLQVRPQDGRGPKACTTGTIAARLIDASSGLPCVNAGHGRMNRRCGVPAPTTRLHRAVPAWASEELRAAGLLAELTPAI
jgi:adenosylmethionine-8-amino-7-oxononanoate aminotransferase